MSVFLCSSLEHARGRCFEPFSGLTLMGVLGTFVVPLFPARQCV